MSNFYDGWLGLWSDEQEERTRARKSIQEEDLEWVKTKQDYRAALLCARENGFITAGAIMLAEIPKGWNTGKHSHGEEGIFIVDGEGFSVVDGKKYDWDTGSCLFIPYSSVHQHFNSGDRPVRYLSAVGLGLERFAGLARIMQYEEACETPMGGTQWFEPAESDIHPEYGRIVLRLKDTTGTSLGKGKPTEDIEKKGERALEKTEGSGVPDVSAHHYRSILLMQSKEADFRATEIQIARIMCDPPGAHSGKHSHMEAAIYVLQGEGYSIVDGERIDWKKGTLLHVQGPQTVHQHFNTGQVESRLLRISYGLRTKYFEPIAKREFPYLYYEPNPYA